MRLETTNITAAAVLSSSEDNTNNATTTTTQQRLFGRQTQLDTLQTVLNQTVGAPRQPCRQRRTDKDDDKSRRQRRKQQRQREAEEERPPRQMVWVHGLSGSGKTALIRHALSKFLASGGGKKDDDEDDDSNNSCAPPVLVAEGKFDQLVTSTSTPYSAVLQAFDELGRKCMTELSQQHNNENKDDDEQEEKERLKQCLQFEASLLIKLVPSFALLAPAVATDDNNNNTINGTTKNSTTTSAAEAKEEHLEEQRQQQDSASSNGAERMGPNNDNSMLLATERLALAVRFFLREFTKRVRSLVIFLDDLQWADRYSRELIISIARDQNLYEFVLIGSFRDEEPHLVLPFVQLSSLEATPTGGRQTIPVVTDIPLHNLDLDAVHIYLASLLRNIQCSSVSELQDDDEAATLRPLAELVHRKTDGNPLFVNLLLQQMHAAGYLQYNFGTLQWEWDMEQANAGTDVSANMVQVLTQRLETIPRRVQQILQLASFVGFFVDVDVLRQLSAGLAGFSPSTQSSTADEHSRLPSGGVDHHHDASKAARVTTTSDPPSLSTSVGGANRSSESWEYGWFDQALLLAQEEALVEKVGTWLKFSHDQIRQAIYESVQSDTERDQLHYQIGEFLRRCGRQHVYKNRELHKKKGAANYDSGGAYRDIGPSVSHGDYSAASSAQYLFLSVDQLNRGSRFVENEEGRVALIELNYEASKVARERGEIEAVALFLRKAMGLTRQEDWSYHYQLTLDVFNSSVEVYFSLGMIQETRETIKAIFANVTRALDKVRAMVVEFSLLGTLCEFKEAIALGCKVLRLLGERVPKKVTLFHVTAEYFRARRESRGKPDEFFTKLRPVETEHGELKQRILRIGSVFGWNGDVNFSGFAMLRGFRMAMKDGMCVSTPWHFSGFGFMLAVFGQYGEAWRFGQLALKTGRSKDPFPSSLVLSYGTVMHLQLPVAVALEPFLSGYRTGLETGDLFNGTLCVANYAYVYINCGLPLAPFADDLRNFSEQLRVCHQDLPLSWLLPARQLALNLLGQSSDPVDLSREAIQSNHRELLSDNQLVWVEGKRDVKAEILFMLYLQLYNAYLLQDAPVAEKTLGRILNLKARRFGGTHAFHYFMAFIDGLVGLWLHTNGSKVSKLTKAAVTELTKYAKTGNVNSVTLLKLLQAEIMARKKTTGIEVAREAYNEAISEFGRSGMNHFAAISNELAGQCMLAKKEDDWGRYYMERALRRWSEYSAVVKVHLLTKRYPFLATAAEELPNQRHGSLVQGRSRFDVLTDSVVGPGGTTPGGRGSGRLSSSLTGPAILLQSQEF